MQRNSSFYVAMIAVAVGLILTGGALTKPIIRPPTVRPPVIKPPIVKPPHPHIFIHPHIPIHPNSPNQPWQPGNQPGIQFENQLRNQFGNPMFIPPRDTVAENTQNVRNRIQTLLKDQPEEALFLLAQQKLPEAGLPPQWFIQLPERLTFARDGVNNLAALADKNADVWSALSKVRKAQTVPVKDGQPAFLAGRLKGAPEKMGKDVVPALKISKDGDRALAALESYLLRRGLPDTLTKVHTLIDQGDWTKAGVAVQSPLQYPRLPADVNATFLQIAQLSSQSASLASLETALRDPRAQAQAGPAAAVAVPVVDVASLPAPVQNAWRGLKALMELRHAINSRPAPDVSALKNIIADLQFCPRTESLALRLQQDLAVKCFLDGYPAQARALLPSNGPAQHAADLLHDVHALLVGNGEVGTWPSRRLLDAPDLDVPGLLALLPKDKAPGWRLNVAKAVAPPVTPLQELAKVETAQRKLLTSLHKKTMESFDQEAMRVLMEIVSLQKRHPRSENGAEDDKLLAELKGLLKRQDLLASERILALEMHRQGRNTAEIVAVLAQQFTKP